MREGAPNPVPEERRKPFLFRQPLTPGEVYLTWNMWKDYAKELEQELAKGMRERD